MGSGVRGMKSSGTYSFGFAFTLQGTGGLEQGSDMVLPYPSGVVLPAVFQQTEPRCLLGGTQDQKPKTS